MDFTDIEKIAIEHTLKPLGKIIAEIGMDKPLSAYSRDQVLIVIGVVISNFQMLVIEHTPAPDDMGIPF